MPKYTGIMYDDREPERILHKFTDTDRDYVKEQIDGVYADLTDPEDGVRPLHLKYSINKED